MMNRTTIQDILPQTISFLRTRTLACAIALLLTNILWANDAAIPTLPLNNVGVMTSYTPYTTTLSEVGQAAPYYVPAASGDLQPFGAAAPAIRHAPPKTGGDNPNNPNIDLPIGDIDWFCLLVLAIYTLTIPLTIHSRRRRHTI